MSDFRACIIHVLNRLGIADPPVDYVDDIERLQSACNEWHQQHAAAHGCLEFKLPPSGVLVTGALDLAIVSGWASNPAAKHFVSFIDERTGHVATMLMLQVLIHLQEAVQLSKVNAAGGTA